VERFRRAEKGDADAIFKVVASAFSLEEGSPKWKRKRDLVHSETEHFLVLEEDGGIVATCVVHPHRLWVGRSQVLKGDVGEVSVLRELQGRGLGTRLVREVSRWMEEEGFHISRLGGLNRFYGRFGWVPFPRWYYEFPLTSVGAGASRLSVEEVLSLPEELRSRVRPYDPERDGKRRLELYRLFYEGRTGALVREGSEPPGAGPHGLDFVYEREGEIVGYVAGVEYPGEVSPFEPKVAVHEAAFDLASAPESLWVLMKYVLLEAHRRGALRVAARLPFDPAVERVLREGKVYFQKVELMSAYGSNMVKIVNLRRLLGAISPTLEGRLSALPYAWEGRVRLEVDGQEAVLVVGPSVQVDEGEAGNYIRCDAHTMMRLVLGLSSFGELEGTLEHDLPREAVATFSALFPREPVATGPWG